MGEYKQKIAIKSTPIVSPKTFAYFTLQAHRADDVWQRFEATDMAKVCR